MNQPVASYDALIAEARETLERFAPGTWTDFNAHDPGVTLLEYMAEALADCSFRIDLPVGDLIASASGPHLLAPPADLLASCPVTGPDLRALLIDIPEVRNAWVTRNLGGLLDITVDTAERLDPASLGWLRRDIHERLARQRLLGTDIGDIRFQSRQPVSASLVIAAGRGADAEAVAGDVAVALDALLTNLPVYGISERAPADDPHAGGPLVTRGLFDSSRLGASDLSDTLVLDDLTADLHARLPGLQVRDLRLARQGDDGAPVHSAAGILPLDPDKAYELDPETLDLGVLINGRLVSPDANRLRTLILRARAARQDPASGESPPEAGTRRDDLAAYPSVQHDFPEIYGLKKGALPPKAGDTRLAQAKQLQAFLLLLEQPVADLLMRLKASTGLLGLTVRTESPPAGRVDFDHLHKGLEKAPTTLQAASAADMAASREIAVLTESWRSFSLRAGAKDDLPVPSHSGSGTFTDLTAQASNGWNYLSPPVTPGALTAFERLVAGTCLRPHTPEGDAHETATLHPEGTRFRYHLSPGGDDLIFESLVTFADETAAREAAAVATLSLAFRGRYRVGADASRTGLPSYGIALIDEAGNPLAAARQSFDSRTAADRAIDRAARHAAPVEGGGVYLVEHILLRPEDGPNALAPAFHHQMTLVLPAGQDRWRQGADLTTIDWLMDEMLPAHLMVHVLTLDTRDMAAFETVYFAWLQDFWGGGPALGRTRDAVTGFLAAQGIEGWTLPQGKEAHDDPQA